MKTLFRVLSLAVLLTAFSVLTFAQDGPSLEELFTKFRTEIKAKCGERDPALATGKTIIEKFGSDELNKEIIDFVKKKMAEIEKAEPRCKLNIRYDATYKAKDWPQFLDVSKQIMAMEGDTPLGLDILLTHVSVGYDRGATDSDELSYAKLVLARLDAGKASQLGTWGVFEGFKTKDFPDGKANAQGWMNFIIGSVTYDKLKQEKEALPYFYKVTQVVNEKQKLSSNYTNIGNYYFKEAVRLDGEYRAKREANNKEDNDETRALLGLARGTADRASDAFGRALKLVSTPTAKAAIAKTLVDLYKFRFNLSDAKQPDVDKYVSDLTAKPMPDPATPVTPVVIEVPATASTTTPSTTSTTPSTTSSNTKPTTPTTKSTTPTTSTTPSTTTTTKTPVKKPVTKKKGTR